mgnify:CR=1 FL=1
MKKFQERLNQALNMRKMTAAELSRRTRVPAAVISQYRSGRYEPKQDRVDLFASVLRVNAAWLMGYDIEPENNNEISIDSMEKWGIRPISTKKIPLLGNIACGEPRYADEDRSSYVEVGTDIKADFCLRAKGDSMINARINDGDIVFVRAQNAVDNGEIAVVVINDESTLKRVYFYPNNNLLVLKPENPKYAEITYSDESLNDVKILGKAIAFQSDII